MMPPKGAANDRNKTAKAGSKRKAAASPGGPPEKKRAIASEEAGPVVSQDCAVIPAKSRGPHNSMQQAHFERTKAAAEAGNVVAQHNLAIMYEYGNGVDGNVKEAARWYRKAADAGNAKAQNNLGLCYQNGTGVVKDWKQAVQWYRTAAASGNADAQSNLGRCYLHGEGVGEDHKKAVELFRQAADAGSVSAEHNLGHCYGNGKGVEEDATRAHDHFLKAADAGDPVAQYNLGIYYHYGKGVAKDEQKAKQWYRKAALSGHARARLAFDEFRAGTASFKFQTRNCLDYDDMMEDGFYDPGRDGTDRTLEEYRQLSKEEWPKTREILSSEKNDKLQELLSQAVEISRYVTDEKARVQVLMLLVSNVLGGSPSNTNRFKGEAARVRKAMEKAGSCVLPISAVFYEMGSCRRRCFLFFILGRTLGLRVRLVRGYRKPYKKDVHAWNVVQLEGKEYVVDLMEPGLNLIPANEAGEYVCEGMACLPEGILGAGTGRFPPAPTILLYEDLNLQDPPIASGKFSECWLAIWKPNGCQVFVKTLPREVQRNAVEEATAQLKHELWAHLMVKHVNIVKLHGYCEEPLTLVFRYVPDGSLHEVLETKELPLDEKISILVQVARALTCCHSSGVVHCDVKPGNVLYDCKTKKALLTDFGIARPAKTIATAAVAGTDFYMAPEAVCKRQKELTDAVDVYSFACFAFEVLTSEIPGEEAVSRLKKGYREEYKKPEEQRQPVFTVGRQLLDAASDLGDQAMVIQQLLNSCLHVTPAKRPSMDTVWQRLRTIAGKSKSNS